MTKREHNEALDALNRELTIKDQVIQFLATGKDPEIEIRTRTIAGEQIRVRAYGLARAHGGVVCVEHRTKGESTFVECDYLQHWLQNAREKILPSLRLTKEFDVEVMNLVERVGQAQHRIFQAMRTVNQAGA